MIISSGFNIYIMELLKLIINKLFCCHDWGKWQDVSVKDPLAGTTYSVTYFKCIKCGKFEKIKSY